MATSTPFFAVMNGLMLVTVVNLQVGVGADAHIEGLTLLPFSAGLGIASYAAGTPLWRSGRRQGYRSLTLAPHTV
ncbi:MAG: hypothetical protein ACRDRL_17760 [Sciscionella sp.]